MFCLGTAELYLDALLHHLVGSLFSLLADDYPTKSIASFPLSPATFADFSPGANSSRFLNTLLSLGAQCSPGLANANSTLVSPLSLARDTFVLPGQQSLSLGASVNYAPERDYHTSAVLAAALDTVSMPWRSLNRSG